MGNLKTESRLDAPNIELINYGREPDDLIPDMSETEFDEVVPAVKEWDEINAKIISAIKTDWNRMELYIDLAPRDKLFLIHGFIAGQRHPEIKSF